MIEIVQFQPEHLLALKLQATQATAESWITRDLADGLKGCPLAMTALVDGKPVACAGLAEQWQGRAYAWSFLGESAASYFRHIHRAVLAVLAEAKYRRVEMAVDVRDPAAKRWAWHLGFDFEGVARKWAADGRDVEIWARVK